MTKKRIHQVYGWVLTIGLLAAGALLIQGCVSIYRLGDRPFTPEAVAVAFSRISVPVYLCLGLIAGSFLLQLCLPVEQKRSVTPQLPMQLAKLQARLDLQQTEPMLREQIKELRWKRRLHSYITCGLLVLFGGFFLW